MDRSFRLDMMARVLQRLAEGERDDFVIFSDHQEPENYVQLTQDGLIEVTSRDYPDSRLPKLTAEQIAALTNLGFSACADPNHRSTIDLTKPEAIAELCDRLFNILGSLDTFDLDVSVELTTEDSNHANPERRAAWNKAHLLIEHAGRLRQERLYTAATDQFEAAVAKVQSLNSIEDTNEALRQLANFLSGIGEDLWRRHDAAATSYLERALSIYRKIRYPRDGYSTLNIVQTLRTLGDVYMRTRHKRPSVNLALYKRAIAVYEELVAVESDNYEAVHARSALAILYDKVGDVEHGRVAYRQILPLLGKNKWVYGRCLDFFLRHNLLADLSFAASICDENIGSGTVAEHFSDGALRLIWNGQFKTADRLLHQLLAVGDTTAFPMERDQIHGLLGYCQEKNGHVDRALDIYRTAIADGSRDQLTFTRLLINLQRLKRWAEALAIVDLGLSAAADDVWKADLERRRQRLQLKEQPAD